MDQDAVARCNCEMCSDCMFTETARMSSRRAVAILANGMSIGEQPTSNAISRANPGSGRSQSFPSSPSKLYTVNGTACVVNKLLWEPNVSNVKTNDSNHGKALDSTKVTSVS